MECIEQNLTGSADFGRKVSVTVLRNGDLATRLYLRVVVNSVVDVDFTGRFAWVRRLGHELINNVDVEIGGSQIDKHYGTWMDVWYELTHTSEQERGYKKCIGDVAELTELTHSRSDGTFKDAYTMFVPLQFWFCRNPGLALPLIALQYHEVRLNIEFNPANELAVYSPGFNLKLLTMGEATLLVDYVYLDTEERRRFAQVGHEYLIEQIQFTGAEAVPVTTGNSTNMKVKLQFNHPSKELIWAIQGGNFTSGETFLAYTHEDDWSNALDAAAENIAEGMFKVAASNPAVGTGTAIEVSAGGRFPTSTINTTSYVNIDVSGTLATGQKLWMEQDVYCTSNKKYNLGDKIDFVAVSLNSDQSVGGTAVSSVKVLVHSVSIRDISIPLSSWIDNRLNTSVSTGVNANDVIIYQWHNFGVLLDGSGNPVDQALIQLNGQDRFNQREGSYFNYVQPLQHHTHTPADGVNVYSFALHPEQHQPSGTANLSRIDSTMLNLQLLDPTAASAPEYAPSLNYFNSYSNLYVYDVNYNVLRIMSGMGGLASYLYRAEKHLFQVHLSTVLVKYIVVSKSCKRLHPDASRLMIQSATRPNCGKLLKTRVPKHMQKCMLAEIKNSGKVKISCMKRNLKWTIRSQAPKVAWIRLGRRFNDYMVLGLRGLINLDESLRYSLVPGEYPINTPKGGVETIQIKQTNRMQYLLYFCILFKIQNKKMNFVHYETI